MGDERGTRGMRKQITGDYRAIETGGMRREAWFAVTRVGEFRTAERTVAKAASEKKSINFIGAQGERAP